MGSLAFTWAPNPKIFGGINPIYQHNDCMPLIRNMSKCCEYKIYPELTTQGNIHYHGIIDVFDKVKWFKSVLPKLKYNGHVLIKEIFDYDKWNDYISKDSVNMLKILDNEMKLPLTSTRKQKNSIPNSDEIKNLDN